MRIFTHLLHVLVLLSLLGVLAVGAQADMTLDQALYGAYDGSGDVDDSANWGEFPSEPWSGQFQVGIWVDLDEVDDGLVGATIKQYVWSSYNSWELMGTYSHSGGSFVSHDNNGTPNNYADDWGFCVVNIPQSCDDDYDHTENNYKLEITVSGITLADPDDDPLPPPGGGVSMAMMDTEPVTVSWTKYYDGLDVTIDWPYTFSGGNGSSGPLMWADDDDTITVGCSLLDGSEAPFAPNAYGPSASISVKKAGVGLEWYQGPLSEDRWRAKVIPITGNSDLIYSDPDDDAPSSKTWSYNISYPSDTMGWVAFDRILGNDMHPQEVGDTDGIFSTTDCDVVQASFDVDIDWFGQGGPVRYYNQEIVIDAPGDLTNWKVVRVSKPYENTAYKWTALSLDAQNISYSPTTGHWTIGLPEWDGGDAGTGLFDEDQAATLYVLTAQDGDTNCDDNDGRWIAPLGCVFSCHGGNPNPGEWNPEVVVWDSSP
ncbi:MAG: hypothetical protein GF320_21470 [Armatimonadia bacterium]|nr:hypothetical protein [Armatimonadia bacterium]